VKASASQCISEASEKAHPKAFLNALHRVNELRLICNHGVKDKDANKSLEVIATADSGWTAEAAQTLFDEMETAGIALCSNPQCGQDLSSKMSSETDMQRMEEPRIGESSDLFCSTCIEVYVNQTDKLYTICNHLPRCPSIRTNEKTSMALSIFSSIPRELPTKIEAVIKDLSGLTEGTKRYASIAIGMLKQANLPINSVVFSSWTKTFDLIQPVLINRSIRCVRLDGSLSTAGRDKVLRAFRDNSGIAVLLATISCGGIGLNLTAASRAYIVEPQWNPMSESQALDRIHRLGQRQEVYTTRYLMRGTWEEVRSDHLSLSSGHPWKGISKSSIPTMRSKA
jgi:SWI/SNF-related matrix-associated actin-dependent regulator of chromatin subfamily A3